MTVIYVLVEYFHLEFFGFLRIQQNIYKKKNNNWSRMKGLSSFNEFLRPCLSATCLLN